MNMVDTEQLAERLEKAPFLPRYPIHLTCSEDELRAIIYALRAPAHIGDECGLGREALRDARTALGLALLASGLDIEIKNRLRTAWLKVGDALTIPHTGGE